MKPKVYVIDNESFYVASLSALLDSSKYVEVVGSTSEIEAAIKALSTLKVDILISDIRMPKREDGYNFMAEVRRKMPSLIIIAITHDTYYSLIPDFHKNGWNGLMHKEDINENNFLEACKRVFVGETYFSDKIKTYERKQKAVDAKYNFTKGEKEIFPYLYKGLSYKEIGLAVHRSKESIKDRVQNILKISGCKSSKHLPKFLSDHGFIDAE